MISYEKVKKGLQSANLTILILKCCSIIFTIIGTMMTFMASKQLNDPTLQKQYSSEQLDAIKKASQITPFDWFTTAVLLVLSIVIIVYCFKNRGYLKNNQRISTLPYILGIVSVIASVLLTFLNYVSKEIQITSFTIISAAIPALIMLALYIYSYLQSSKLNNRDHSEEYQMD